MRRTPLPPDTLDRFDLALLDRLQDGLPLTPRPFAGVAAALDLSEDDVLARIGRLKSIGAITRFGPFMDAAAMGGAFCLCAMAIPDAEFERAVTLVNAHPEVAHNYERDHRLNMWFVLACDTGPGIGQVADRIEAETGHAVLRFPKLKEFFIGFKVKM